MLKESLSYDPLTRADVPPSSYQGREMEFGISDYKVPAAILAVRAASLTIYGASAGTYVATSFATIRPKYFAPVLGFKERKQE